MERRNYRKLNQQILDVINKKCPDVDFKIEVHFNGPRLVRRGGSVDVSPIMSHKELFQWLHAFLAGIEAIEQQNSYHI